MIHGSNLRKIYHNVQSNTRLNLRFPTAEDFLCGCRCRHVATPAAPDRHTTALDGAAQELLRQSAGPCLPCARNRRRQTAPRAHGRPRCTRASPFKCQPGTTGHCHGQPDLPPLRLGNGAAHSLQGSQCRQPVLGMLQLPELSGNRNYLACRETRETLSRTLSRALSICRFVIVILIVIVIKFGRYSVLGSRS